MPRRKVLVAGRKSITMDTGEGRNRVYYSAEAAALWWAKFTCQMDFYHRGRPFDKSGKREKKLRRRALPIFERYFNS